MGKQPTKKNQQSKIVRSVSGGAYVVRGKRFPIQHATADAIAADMASNGYRDGARARWNGGEYRLTADYMADGFRLERIA